jgi:hypothetical protein
MISKWIFKGWWQLILVVMAGVAVAPGCGTTSQRLATEQLLVSDAVDVAINDIDFSKLFGKKVYMDTTFLKPISGVGFVNADYIISSLRQQMMAAGCLVEEERDKAEIIVEPRVGALGSNRHEVTYGVPATGQQLTTVATAVSGAPVMPLIPEISVGRTDVQNGIAKIYVFAYDRSSREAVWQSGLAKSESTSSSTWFLGAGPFQKGTIHNGMRFAGRELEKHDETKNAAQPSIPYNCEVVFPARSVDYVETMVDNYKAGPLDTAMRY